MTGFTATFYEKIIPRLHTPPGFYKSERTVLK